MYCSFTQLFKKPLYSSSLSLQSIDSLSPTTPTASHASHRKVFADIEPKNANSPLKFRPSNLSKLTRAHSLSDDDPILKRKFHTFFKAVMQGRINEQEVHDLWERLQ